MARGDEVKIIFPITHWKGVLNRRGTSPEEKGYYFLKEGNGEVLAMFSVVEATGSEVEVTSSDIFLDAIKIFTERHEDIHIIPYHTHPIEGPSRGDLNSYGSIYKKTGGQIRDFLTIGPRTVELNRVYSSGRIDDIVKMDRLGNPTTNLVKIIRFHPEKDEDFRKELEKLGVEFHAIVRRLGGRAPVHIERRIPEEEQPKRSGFSGKLIDVLKGIFQ